MLRLRVVPLLALLCTVLPAAASPVFDRLFTGTTLRIDIYHTGTKGSETISLHRLIAESEWPGTRVHLLDTLNLGEYMVRAVDAASGELIFSRGYSTMFNEWQSTDEALSGVVRTFHETVRMPHPKKKVQVTISRRDRSMLFHEVFSCPVDPNSPSAVDRARGNGGFAVVPLVKNGDPEHKVDLLVLGDGYAAADMEKFRRDVKHFTDALFSASPFKERKGDFNVWTIEVVSGESGIDKPDKNVWKNNALGSAYHTFSTPRYILTEDDEKLRDIASAAPYDCIHILCNDDRYGGGGIYNLYATCYTKTDKAGMEWQMDYVYVHEFGHSFAGLGDEYYSSQVAYNDFYQKGIEPWEPNITALVDTPGFKWRRFVAAGTPVPTPWDKSRYDSLGRERGKLDRLAADYYDKRKPLYDAEQAILKGSPRAAEVGAFEGAGYVSHGLYRPAIDCRMFSLSLVGFDPVCSDAINRMIDFYAD